MSQVFRRSSLLACLSMASALILVVGCGDDGLGKRYPVSGKVTYKGQPVAEGTISFYAAGAGGESRGAFGTIKDGNYKLSTQGEDDGAFPGDYNVSVNARLINQDAANKNAGAGSARQDDVAKAYKTAKSAIPLKYESPEKSGLKAKVTTGSNTFNFDLTD